MMLFLALSGIVSGIIATCFGLFVLLKNPRGIINRTYALLSLCIAVWGYAYFFYPLSQNSLPAVLLSFQILHIGAIFIGPSFMLFILSLLNLHKQKRPLILSAFIIGALLVISDFTPLFIKSMSPKLSFKYWANPGPTYHLYLIFWSGCVLYPWYQIIKNYRALTESKQNQIKYVFVASVIGFIGGATNYPLPSIPWFSGCRFYSLYTAKPCLSKNSVRIGG
ncbi:MAG: hypothetical protein NTY14_01645 [Candidatus Omnitrophica bacterium]|nr:hypothetical protein [Candidatus Omnitrophota bacterium]